MASVIGIFTNKGIQKTIAAQGNVGWFIYIKQFAVAQLSSTLPLDPELGDTLPLQPTWYTDVVSGWQVVDNNTVQVTCTIPPGQKPLLTVGEYVPIGDIYLYAQDHLGNPFLLVVAQPDITLEYDNLGTTRLIMSIQLNNVNLSSLYSFTFTEAKDIYDHNLDPAAHEVLFKRLGGIAGLYQNIADHKYVGQYFDELANFVGSQQVTQVTTIADTMIVTNQNTNGITGSGSNNIVLLSVAGLAIGNVVSGHASLQTGTIINDIIGNTIYLNKLTTGSIPNATALNLIETLNYNWWTIVTPAGAQYYVWYNASLTGIDPGLNVLNGLAGYTGIEVNFTAGATANTVASLTAAALTAELVFSASALANVVTVNQAQNGPATAAADFGTGFTVTVTVPGTLTVTQGQLVYRDSSGLYHPSDFTQLNTQMPMAFADTSRTVAIFSGLIDYTHAYANQTLLYLHATTPGLITDNSTSGLCIGYAMSNNLMFLQFPRLFDSPVENSSLALTNGSTIAVNLNKTKQSWIVESAASQVILSNTPFGVSPPQTGTEIELIGVDDDRTVTIPYADIPYGFIGNGPCSLAKNQMLTVRFNATLVRYTEMGRSE